MGKDNEILEASRSGNFDLVEKLLIQKAKKTGPLASLRRGPGPNLQDGSGNTALHYASMKGNSPIVRLLLSLEANPNVADHRGTTPLHLAAWGGYHDIVNSLLTNPRTANPNQLTINKESPLHCAAQHGHTKVLTVLLAHGANADIRNDKDESPLDLAAQYGRLQAVQLLIRANPELIIPLKFESTLAHSPLHLASRNGHLTVVDVLLAAGVFVNLMTPNGSALHEAALFGKEHVAKLLLAHDIDTEAQDADGRSVLDLLMEFPPHVTRNMVALINKYRQQRYGEEVYQNHRHQMVNNLYGRNSYEGRDFLQGNTSPMSVGSLNGRVSPNHHHKYSKSLDHNSYLQMKAAVGEKASPPKKPPRRNLSVSPTHLDHGYTFSTFEDHSSTSKHHHELRGITMNYLAAKHRLNRGVTVDQYLYASVDSTSISTNITTSCSSAAKLVNYENKMIRVPNPKRKLKRQKDSSDSKSFEAFFAPRTNSPSSSHPSSTTPLSPTNYNQPPTPKHPPPSAQVAERMIIERLRPLSQEYKRMKYMQEMGHSPSDLFNKSLGTSSGSLSSSISISDRSCSTDCVEEYVSDVPFAGLFKGSTMNLDNPSAFYQSYLNNCIPKTNNGITPTYQQHTTKQEIQLPNSNTRVDITITTNKYTLDDLSNGKEHVDKVVEPEIMESNGSKDGISIADMSPFDEQEEWAKISEIMESFGSTLGRESVFADDEDIGKSLEKRLSCVSSRSAIQTPMQEFLNRVGLIDMVPILQEHGFDNIDFLHGVVTMEDMAEIGIPDNDRSHLMESIKDLPTASTIYDLYPNNESQKDRKVIKKFPSVDQWLKDIGLDEYKETFRRHLYTDMERVLRIWEIELQAVLEINKLGHRKRILYSVAGQKNIMPPALEEIKDLNDSIYNDDVPESPQRTTKITTNGTLNPSHSHKKRQAPKPPIEIRAPDELLLGPTGLKTQWRHTAATLVSGSVKYEVFYLGSTVVKELRGTESTRKSIQKLKRGERSNGSGGGGSSGDDTLKNSKHQFSTNSRRPVCIAISQRGVLFIDIESQGTICEHEIRNINCACQDSDDLSHFAYITKDSDNETHYCHVFSANSMDLATEIILTLGQAFEVAYQLALRDASQSVLQLRSPSSAGIFNNNNKK